jgi:hypothetical protein
MVLACECDGFARQSSKLLDKVRFLGELLRFTIRYRWAARRPQRANYS